MSKNKSFFQKLSDSLTSLFPFNSTTRENVSEVPFDNKLSPIRTSNRRVASVAFGKDEDEYKMKKARLHYDLKSLPTSRIIKSNNTLQDKYNIYNNFNDTASELSESSNISVSTSGVSSLHPRSSKRLYLGNTEDMNINSKYPRNLNVTQKIISPISNKSFRNAKEFISSPAKKILEKLDKLTTPITAADKLTSLLMKERVFNSPKFTQQLSYSPYGRPVPPIAGKKPLPVKAVTISGSSNDKLQSSCGPIRSKHSKKMKRLGYLDDIDLDSEPINNNYDYYPKLNDSNQIKFNNIPVLKKSISTNTEGNHISNLERSPSPDLEFTFRPPQTVNDEDYLSFHREEAVNFQFKSKISEKERSDYHKRINVNMKSDKLWRCDTCFSENSEESLQCTNCGNISKKNSSMLILPKKTICNIEKINTNEDNKSEEKLSTKCNRESESSAGEIKIDLPKIASIPVSRDSGNVTSSSNVKSSLFNTKAEVSNINSPSPVETLDKTSESKLFSLGQGVDSNNVSSSIKPLSFEKTSESSSLSKPFSFGQGVDSTNVSSSIKPLSFENTSKSSSLSKPFSLGQEVDSTSVSSSIKPLSFEKTSESSSFGQGVNSTIFSSVIKPFSSEKTSDSSSFGQGVNSTIDSSAIKPLSFDKTSESKPFAFGQVPLSSSTESTNSPFGTITGVETSNLSSKPFSFSQPKDVEVKSSVAPSNTTPFVFGKLSNSEPVVSVSISTNKSFPFGNVSNSVSSTNSIFNQTTNTVTTSILSTTTSPFLFGVQGSSSIPASTSFSLGQTPTTSSEKSMFPTNPSFSFGQSSVATSNTGLMFSTSSSANEKPFSFGQGMNNGETSTSKPSPFTFGQMSSNSSANQNSKPPVLFGQTNNEGKSLSSTTTTTSSKFLFGQSSSSAEQQNSQQSAAPFTNSGSSLFGGDYQKSNGSTTSLFGNNPLQSQSAHSGPLFAAVSSAVVAAPLSSIDSSKPSFAFGSQPIGGSMFGGSNSSSSSFGVSFNSTPSQLNFTQLPTINQNSSQFSLPNNNNQLSSSSSSSVNMFGAPQNNPFQFGGGGNTGSATSSTTFPNSQQQQQSGFNFNANTPAVFQFGGGSSGVSNSNGPNLSVAGAATNARRTLKSRRKLK